MRKRFEQEVSTTRLIGPRNILRIHESELAADRPYYVAEYYEGKSPDKTDAGQFFGNMHQATEVLLLVIDALVIAPNVVPITEL